MTMSKKTLILILANLAVMSSPIQDTAPLEQLHHRLLVQHHLDEEHQGDSAHNAMAPSLKNPTARNPQSQSQAPINPKAIKPQNPKTTKQQNPRQVRHPDRLMKKLK